jgi:hypothetical protein
MSAGQPSIWKALAVLIGMAATLRALDAVMVWTTGVPRGVLVCASLDEAEQRTGVKLSELGRLAQEYALVGDAIRATASPAAAVSVGLRARRAPVQHLTVYRSAGGAIPERLRTPLPAFHEIRVPIVGDVTGELRAEAFPDGSVWQDMEWSDTRGRTALRFDGQTVQLLRIARRLAMEPR